MTKRKRMVMRIESDTAAQMHKLGAAKMDDRRGQ
nr:MAG TPA: capsid protein [Caudoviricetes sp.]